MKKRRTRFCQSFSVTLDDGTVVHGHGQFTGPITDKDREAIAEVVKALRQMTGAKTIDSVMITKPEPQTEPR